MIYEVTSQVISLLKQSVWSKVHYNLSENQSTWNITVGKFKLFCFLNDINCQYLQHLKVLRSKYIFGAMRNVFIRYINPTPVQVGHIPPPCRKMAITPKNNDPREPKGFVKREQLCFRSCDFYFSYKYSQPNFMEGVLLTKSEDKQINISFYKCMDIMLNVSSIFYLQMIAIQRMKIIQQISILNLKISD